jgi:toluene monooxygenase system protein E
MTLGYRPGKRRRTWSAFGEVRRVPSEYEVVTHATNWTLREGRSAALEANPSSPQNLWYETYRDRSPLRGDFDEFRDPDQLTYRKYVSLQDDAETVVAELLEQYADARHDESYSAGWLETLGALFVVTRFPSHAFQMAHSYLGQMAPASYITNAATFSAADMLRRVTLVSYRTRELELTHPGRMGRAVGRRHWETTEAWQAARRALEQALVAYDWGECFVAVNLVLRPTFDDILLRQLGEVARANGDELTWLLLCNLDIDAERCRRWSGELLRYALSADADNARAVRRWVERWAPRADAAAHGLALLLAQDQALQRPATDTVQGARDAVLGVLAGSGLPGFESVYGSVDERITPLHQ